MRHCPSIVVETSVDSATAVKQDRPLERHDVDLSAPELSGKPGRFRSFQRSAETCGKENDDELSNEDDEEAVLVDSEAVTPGLAHQHSDEESKGDEFVMV